MKFSFKDFCSGCDQIHSFLRIGSHLLKNSLMENLIFCEVYEVTLTKSKVKDLIQLSKKKSQITKFSRVSSFHATHNSHSIKRTRIILSKTSLQHKLLR